MVTHARRTIAALTLGALLVSLPGCLLGAAAAGAGAVLVMSEDTVQIDVKADRASVYEVAVSKLEARGNVTLADEVDSRVEGEVGGSTVKISVFTVEGYTRARVSARKLGGTLPDIDLAKVIASELSRAF